MQSVTVQAITDTYLAECCALMQNAPDPWTPAAITDAVHGERYSCFAAVSENAPVACAVFLPVSDTADLCQLVTAPDFRGRGIAQVLLRSALSFLREQGVSRCLLEVRISNAAAISLYEKLGFKTLARRPKMYAHPTEDGLLMALNLSALS